MHFHKTLERLLTCKEPQEKFTAFYDFYDAYKNASVAFDTPSPKTFDTPSYAAICTVVSPRDVPKRKRFDTAEGQIHLIHAIAHIEYSAIDLALDICYRFGGLPKAFYDDWLEVADDEIRHFLMLEKLLHELGAEYGDIAVHDALFEASQKTAHSLLHRLAVVPRYLEANGLDATPMILQRLQRLPSAPITDELIASLQTILREEVSHVHKGDRWFEYACKKEGIDKSAYFDIIYRYYPRGFAHIRTFNKEARLEAGFTCNELKTMAKREVCQRPL